VAAKKSTPEGEAEEKDVLYLLYRGAFVGTDKKTHHLYINVGASWRTKPCDPNSRELQLTFKKALGYGGATVGGIYHVKTEPGNPNTVYTKSAALDGMWPIKQDVIDWQSREDMARAERTRLSAEASWRKRKIHLEVLEPLRKAYHRLPFNQQPAFLMAIGRAVTSTKPLTPNQSGNRGDPFTNAVGRAMFGDDDD
jgi:hypothetical protein